ncbi:MULTISPECIES: hypothetical protein [unclassified Serratia (in: enterobacteria)]|uniref:hypothetical protein n=1 Tax=unclassified Serratia (in: enterobacteria) TaxID=2647522 RepID=UPI00069036A7|nr:MULTISPECIES: hypothetical protein [unclassified Serratia (in: enterobacteria)]
MLSDLERWVGTFDFRIKPSHQEAPGLPIEQIIPRVSNLFNNGNAVKMYQSGSRALRVSQFRYDEAEGTLTLLMQLSDKRMADPVFADLESGTLRVEPKLEGEGIAVSAHFIIKTEPNVGSVDHYKTVIECVPGITKSVFEPFLNWLLRTSYENEEFVSELTNRKYKLRPVLDVISHTSQTLEESLAGSRLQGIRLISTNRVDGMDKNPYTETVEKVIRLKVVKQPGRTGKVRLLNSLWERGKRQGYNKVSISYSKDGKQSSLDFDVREDAATKLFTKMEKVILPDGIGQCEEQIHEDLREKMVRILNA